jgi:CubicO group peptidase (beta-lactamase class C family)
MTSRWWIGGLWLLAAGPTLAQSPTRYLDSVFATVRRHPSPAIAMMVMRGDRIVYQNAAGFADLERSVPASVETRFDVASIAKQFTAFAVARLVREGRLAVSDRVDRHFPELDLGGARITVDQLLHHTSGLEDADGLMVLAGWRPGDQVEVDALVRLLLAQQHLRFAPGERHFYSNGGYLLLSELVARLSGGSFAAYCDSTIFWPLEMASSRFIAHPRVLIPNRATPYARPFGREHLELSYVDTYPGAGGLTTTVGDLARWARHLLHPGRDSVATMMLRERGRLRSGETIDYAWGLGSGSYRGQTTLAHAGSGAATEAQLLLFPELDFAVAVLAAGPTGINPSTLAFRAADQYLGDRLAPVATESAPRSIMLTAEMVSERPSESEGVVVPEATLRGLTGTYRLGDDPPMVVRPAPGRLEFAWGGRPPYIPLFPLPNGRFVMVPTWDVYSFPVDAHGRATAIVRERTSKSLRRSGPERVEGRRLPDPPPFDSASAAPYLGWYYGDEVGTFYEVRRRGGDLELRHARLGVFRLIPLGAEEFGVESNLIATVRFARVGAAVTGMELEAYSWSVRSPFRKMAASP